MKTQIKPRRVALLASAALALGVAACGSDDEPSTPAASGNGTDLAFVKDMIPHHESAIEMAQIARERSKRPEILELAGDIINAQRSEIRALTTIQNALTESGVKPTSLGVPAHQMGMDADNEKLRSAKEVDREFIDMMIPHHQGAIRMARVEREKGDDSRAKALAEDIIAAQAREIDQMNKWREEWYGSPSPAGGVPAEGETPPAEDDGEHGAGHSG